MKVLAKTCSAIGCEKRLNSNNTTGLCMAHKSRATPVDIEPSPRKWAKPKRLKVAGDVLTRFKAVADGLGFNGAGMLEEFAQSWLDALHSKAESLPGPAIVKREQLRPAPVRLQAGRAADDRQAADAGAGA